MSSKGGHRPEPLLGVRVLDLTHARAGPTATRQLADWGADVVRIERPGPVDAVAASSRDGSDFQNLHRNKRAVTLDLKQPRGHEIFLKLARGADVLVENFRPAVKKRLGVDYPTLRALNPGLVYASISGFGQSGPYRERGGVDQIAQGMAGLMSVTGDQTSGPLRVGTAISDLAAGLYLSFAVATALYERERTGEGRWVHTSLLEAMIGMLDFQAARYLVEGVEPQPMGNHHPTLSPMGTFPTRDGWINLAASSDRLFERLCCALDAPELAGEERFASARTRQQHREELETAVAERTREACTEHWMERLTEVGVPCGPVNSVAQAFADPQVEHLGLAAECRHSRLGTIRLVAQPLHFDETPFGVRRSAPDPGEHTDEVLAELGLGAVEIEALRAEGVIA